MAFGHDEEVPVLCDNILIDVMVSGSSSYLDLMELVKFANI